eukprot:TRINITY_DN2122_c0_g1_i1.p1 TRINITY_DN2122_c0_g1~~TRINITY_DN2122_c0_g1_i1.p1  ORF type:complete len:172 (-),score=33.47 TRINITY_DN2122_c0_g1_i1:73-588(-)
MGFKTYAPYSAPNKAERQESTDLKSTSRSLGFRLTGYKHVKEETGEVELVGKDITFAISEREVLVSHFKKYFSVSDKIRWDVVNEAISETEKLVQWYTCENTKFEMYSASLLFMWDAENPEPHARVRLIDMAHVIPITEGRDDNVIGGMKNLVEMLKEIAKLGMDSRVSVS